MRFVRPSKRDVYLAIFLYVLNIFDTVCTTLMVTSGKGMEMNPLMDFLIRKDIRLFIGFKVIVPIFVTALLLFLPTPKRVNTALLFLAGMYTMLAIVHLLVIWSLHG